MQDKFIKFLNKNIERKKVKQVFITTHSTFITAAVQLDDLICLLIQNIIRFLLVHLQNQVLIYQMKLQCLSHMIIFPDFPLLNDLIFMSLLLAKMQADSDGKYMGSNAKIFPMLVIEEPEAHLHPTMQELKQVLTVVRLSPQPLLFFQQITYSI